MTEGHLTAESMERKAAVPAITGTCICLWCRRPFEPRRSGGKPQRFCVPAHRRAFETAGRQFLGRLRAAGDLSIAALSAAPATRALHPGAIPGGGATTLAKTVRSRWTSPISVLWSGYDEKAGEPAPRTPEAALGTEDSLH